MLDLLRMYTSLHRFAPQPRCLDDMFLTIVRLQDVREYMLDLLRTCAFLQCFAPQPSPGAN